MFDGYIGDFENDLEAAFWDFDKRVNGYDEYSEKPQGQRDAFKWAIRNHIKKNLGNYERETPNQVVAEKVLESEMWGVVKQLNCNVHTDLLLEKFAETLVLECLTILAQSGNYEGGAVVAFNTIAMRFGIEVSYDELFWRGSEV